MVVLSCNFSLDAILPRVRCPHTDKKVLLDALIPKTTSVVGGASAQFVRRSFHNLVSANVHILSRRRTRGTFLATRHPPPATAAERSTCGVLGALCTNLHIWEFPRPAGVDEADHKKTGSSSLALVSHTPTLQACCCIFSALPDELMLFNVMTFLSQDELAGAALVSKR